MNCCCWLLQFQSDMLYIMYFGSTATALPAQWRMYLLCVLLLASFFSSLIAAANALAYTHTHTHAVRLFLHYTTPPSMHTRIHTYHCIFIAIRLLVYGTKKCKHAHTHTTYYMSHCRQTHFLLCCVLYCEHEHKTIFIHLCVWADRLISWYIGYDLHDGKSSTGWLMCAIYMAGVFSGCGCCCCCRCFIVHTMIEFRAK